MLPKPNSKSFSIWKELCRMLSKKHANEGELEVRFEDCLCFILRYSDNNIARQKTIQFGHERKRADIVLCDDIKQPFVIVEIKKQGSDVSEHEMGQLFSYMRAELISFGFLLGDKFSLYYDERKRGLDPKRVLTLSFRDTLNEDGAVISALLHKENFTVEKMEMFCKTYLSEKERIENDSKEKIIIENLANFRKSDPRKDELIKKLISLYETWLDEDEKEKSYIEYTQKNHEWIANHVLSVDMVSLSDANYLCLFKAFMERVTNLERFMRMWFNNDSKILEGRKDFEKAIAFLNRIPDSERYQAIQYFSGTGEYCMKYLNKSFWSEMIRIRFPDVPLCNDKTQNFFDAIDVYIGDTFEEKLKNISNFYKRFSSDEMTLQKLSHLEHFVMGNIKSKAGKDFVNKNFLIRV